MADRVVFSEAETIEIQRRGDIAFPTAAEIWRLRKLLGDIERELDGRYFFWHFRGAVSALVIGVCIQIAVGSWVLGWGAFLGIGGLLWMISTTQDYHRLKNERNILEAQIDLHRTVWESVSGGIPFQSLISLQYHGNTDPNCDGYREWKFEVLTSISCISVVGLMRRMDLEAQMRSDLLKYKQSCGTTKPEEGEPGSNKT